jgi:hypothetical protein
MGTMTRNQANKILCVILTTIAASPDGAPSGVMYAGLAGEVELADFNELLGICVSTGLVREASRHLYVATDKGRAMAAKVEAFAARVAS